MVKIKVKHEKTTHQIEIEPGDGLETIKAVVMSVTNVPSDRQKLIVKGKEVKEGDDLVKIFKPGAAVLLQGSAEAYADSVPDDLKCEYSRGAPDAPIGFSCQDEKEGVDGAFTTLKAVVADSPADTAGLKKFVGRPLRRANGKAVASSAAVNAALDGSVEIKLIFDQAWAGGGKTDTVLEETPPGLVNLGNTCYLNSCVQTLRVVPEFVAKVDTCTQQPPGGMMMAMGGGAVTDDAVVASLKQTFNAMARQTDGEPVRPSSLVGTIKQRWPTFAQTSPQGAPMQQDAEEFATALMQACSASVNAAPLFTIKTTTTRTCGETDAEPPSIEQKEVRMLTANLDGETSTLEHAIKIAMTGSCELHSSVLGRNATWKQDSAISHMPDFMWVQLNRFSYRVDTQSKAKKLRKVQFPMKLDAYPFCTTELKKAVDPRREQLSEERDRLMEKKRAEKQAKKGGSAAMDVDGEKKEEKKEGGQEAEKAEKKEGDAAATADAEKHADAMDIDGPPPAAVTDGNDSGYYELCGVITHAGRTADSGHYKAFCKRAGEWWCHDDEKSFRVNEDKVKELYGGGEADSAYLLLYRSKDEKGTPAGLW